MLTKFDYIILYALTLGVGLYHFKKFNKNFSEKVSLMSRSVEHLRNMVRTLNSLDDNGYAIIMSQELEELAQQSGKALVILMKNESLSVTNDLANKIAALDTKLLTIRKEGLIRRFDSKKLIQVFSFYSSLLYFAEDILAGTKKL